jgi:hypothetical protein
MEIVQFGGWRCARFTSGEVEIFVTLDVGPRIIRLGFFDAENEFFIKDADLGQSGGSTYRGYGGHRLWIAPEDIERTYSPDNEAVAVNESGGSTWFTANTDAFGVEKSIGVAPVGGGSFRITHRITNQGATAVELAPWALSVMAPGGECLIPQEPFVPHGQSLLPARPLVLWSYTQMMDDRYEWGNRVIRLKHDPNKDPTKFGALVKPGYVGHCRAGHLFINQFGFEPGATYPDFGVNFEAFTRHDMLEVETLGPMVKLQPGQSTEHWEDWTLIHAGNPPENDEECARWLARHIGLD